MVVFLPDSTLLLNSSNFNNNISEYIISISRTKISSYYGNIKSIYIQYK